MQALKAMQRTFYLPIKFDSYFIEPRLSYVKYDYSGSMSGANSTSTAIDSGFFINKQLQEQSSLYYGARIGYQDYSTNISNKTYFIAPTIGVEIFPLKQLSVGVEYRLQLSKTEASSYNTNIVQSVADVVLRYYFKP